MNNAELDAFDPSRLSPEEIEAQTVWRDRRGLIVARVGLLLSIYYLDGFLAEKRDGLMQIVGEFLDVFRDRISHYQRENSRSLTRWDRSDIPRDYLLLAQETERKTPFSVYFVEQTDRKNEDPELCAMMAFAADQKSPTRPLSVVNCHIPLTWFYRNVETFVEMTNRWCGLVKCQHGSAGLGVLSNSGRELQDEPSHYFFLKRFPGLEFDAVGSYLSESTFDGTTAYRRPRSSNWLTMLGDENLALLGGLQTVERQLIPGMKLMRYAGGAIVRAGGSPQWGDEKKGAVPDSYRAAAAIIKPIRFEDYEFGIMNVPDPLDYTEESLKWLRRFD